MSKQTSHNSETSFFNRTNMIAGLFVFVALAVTFVLLEMSRRAQVVKSERVNAEHFAEMLRDDLELALADYELRGRGLTTAFEMDDDISQIRFDRLAERFMMYDGSILNLAFIENSVIKLVHPFESNRQIVGRDLRKVEEQYQVLQRIHKTGKVQLQGPVDLLQGGRGLIVRMPVRAPRTPGARPAPARVISVVIDANAVLKNVLGQIGDTGATADTYFVGLRSRDGIIGAPAAFAWAPVIETLNLPGLRMELGVVPRAGWGAGDTMPWLNYLGLTLVAALTFFIAHVVRQQNAERRTAEVQLKTAIDSLDDGFVLFDAENRLMLCNSKYMEIHDRCADAIKPGARFEDILRLGIARGQFPDAVGREEEWLAEQLRAPGPEGRDFEVGFDRRRWMRVLEKPTPMGGRVGLRIDITRQVATRRRAEIAEQQAQRATQQLMTAVETLPDGFVLYDSDDRLVLCNGRYKEIYSTSAAAMLPGTRFEDILRYGLERGQYSEAVGREEEWLSERLAAHRAADMTIEQELDDGRWLRILERATPDGGRVGLRIDITDQIKSRDRAERAERRLRDAINALPAGFWLFDENNRLEMFNETYCRLYEKSAPAVRIGASSEEILRYGLDNGEYPDAVGREQEWLQELSDRIESGEYEWEYPLQNGKWIRSYNRPTSDGGRVGIRVDITELKRQQAKLEASNARLRTALTERDAAKKRFFDVAEISNDWFWEQDKDLRFTYISEGFDRLLGGNSGLLMGKTREDLYRTIPEVRDSADWEWLNEKLAAREPFRDFVYRAVGSTDDNKWVRVSGAPIFDENGDFAGYRGVGTDISGLYTALREAEAASLAKTDFLNVMSHELRTPLTVVLGYNAFLAKPDLLSSVKALEARAGAGTLAPADALDGLEGIKAEVAQYAGKMEESGKHLLELINEMLDLAKIDAGKLKIESEEIPLDALIASVVDQLSNTAGQKALTLNVDTHGEVAIGDELRLRQILINLLGNALKFTDRGHVSVRTEARDGTVAIHVEDSGCGIPENMHAAIFDQFSQIDSSVTRKAGGTGLGLTISRRLVELQGGKLTLKSRVGVGSTFTFTLPAAASDRAPRKQAADRAA